MHFFLVTHIIGRNVPAGTKVPREESRECLSQLGGARELVVVLVRGRVGEGVSLRDAGGQFCFH